uniref:F-box domain-containing protein n=1 Tax=Mycena chlorophos TaxID=658473 RepID=A0ABQ0LNE9_MYCCL|nr:predicted protein [Mycena chlorophos]
MQSEPVWLVAAFGVGYLARDLISVVRNRNAHSSSRTSPSSPSERKEIPGVSLPADLQHHIILRYAPEEDLRACSLVCGSMCYWAQSRLFREIRFDHELPQASVAGYPSPKKQAQRLLQVLELSPHLVPHIRRLSLEDSTPALLALLASREWPALEALDLYSMRSMHDGCLPDITRLVSSPLLRSLALLFGHRAWHTDYLTRILAHASHTLTNLSLSACVEPHEKHRPPLYPLTGDPLVDTPGFVLRRLDLTYAPAALAALDDPYFAPCLSEVREMEYEDSTPVDHRLLRHLGRQLRRLKSLERFLRRGPRLFTNAAA